MHSLLKPLLGVVLMAGVAGVAQAQAPFAKMEDAIKYRKNAFELQQRVLLIIG